MRYLSVLWLWIVSVTLSVFVHVLLYQILGLGIPNRDLHRRILANDLATTRVHEAAIELNGRVLLDAAGGRVQGLLFISVNSWIIN